MDHAGLQLISRISNTRVSNLIAWQGQQILYHTVQYAQADIHLGHYLMRLFAEDNLKLVAPSRGTSNERVLAG